MDGKKKSRNLRRESERKKITVCGGVSSSMLLFWLLLALAICLLNTASADASASASADAVISGAVNSLARPYLYAEARTFIALLGVLGSPSDYGKLSVQRLRGG
jgi:hypothetical protein